MSSRSRLLPANASLAPLLAAALFLVQTLSTLPGELTNDSREQLQQAISQHYADWHPPVMALVWSWLMRLGGTAGSLLALHQFLHWLGIGLIADGFHRIGRRREAWLVLAAGAFPIFLFYDRFVVKDVGMASALVAGTGMLVWFAVQNKRMPLWVILFSGLCLLYGALIRTNAVFAIGPLLLLYSVGGRRLGIPKIIAWSIVTAVMAVPLSNLINHRLIGATPEYPIQSLQIFDLMGIAVYSADDRVMGANPPEMTEVQACYTSYWWDPVSPWGSCPELRRDLGYTRDVDTTDPATIVKTAQLWWAAILDHPIAYLAHRVQYFNSSLYFIVPALHFRYSKFTDLAPYGTRIITQREIHLDYLKSNFLCWPVVWLWIGVGALALLRLSADAPATVLTARLLITSGLLFAGAYLLIGVATDLRYYYWSIMAILLGAIGASREIGTAICARQWLATVAVGGLLLIIVTGLIARIADVRFV
jgi:hypothetical protein